MYIHIKLKIVKRMKHWVYIYEDEKGSLRIALKTSDDNNLSNLQLNESIVYLRPFDIPFDAIAHKHLLDDLSKETVLDCIDKHKEETKIWLQVFSQSPLVGD
jgi:hypothetical protein